MLFRAHKLLKNNILLYLRVVMKSVTHIDNLRTENDAKEHFFIYTNIDYVKKRIFDSVPQFYNATFFS